MTLTTAYNFSVLAVALWGFTALLLTGEFNPAIILVCYALSAWAYATQSKKRNITFWNLLTAVAFGGAVWLARQSLLNASVYFFMFLQIAKLFNNRSPADARWIYIVAFFNIIGSAVLTTSLGFALVFLVYTLLMCCSLVLSNLKREANAANSRFEQLLKKLPGTSGTRPHTLPAIKVSPRILGSSTITTVLVIAISFWFFTIVPRLSTQRLFQDYGNPSNAQTASSGFDESIEFGALQKIELSDAVAMYVRPFDGQPQQYVRMRGVALDTFDGHRWRRTTNPSHFSQMPFVPFSRRMYPELKRYSVIQPPGVTNFLFGDTFPESLKLEYNNQQFVFDPLSNSVWLPFVPSKQISYAVTSRIERLDERKEPEIPVRRADETSSTAASRFRLAQQYGFIYRAERGQLDPVTEQYIKACSDVPKDINADRIKALAEEWTRGDKTNFQKAMHIEAILKTTYGYTLEPKSRDNFIEDFLFNSKEGHCEYFATSMAIMLRTLGIPSRVVNGFYCVEWNSIGKAFTVRQRDAHSWVEAYLDERYGWMTFDPTPPSGVGRSQTHSALVEAMTHLGDALKIRWYRYVIDYDFTDQLHAMQIMFAVGEYFSRMLESIRFGGFHGTTLSGSYDSSSIVFYLAAALLVAAGCTIIISWLRSAAAIGILNGRRRNAKILVRFYGEILRQLARRGYRKLEGQTPREFATSIVEQTGLTLFPEVTEHYYDLRFGNAPATETDSHLVRELLSQVKTLPRRLRR